MDKHDELIKTAAGSRPAVPVWHLGATGSLHRLDIYNDVR